MSGLSVVTTTFCFNHLKSNMRQEILSNLDNPRELEKIYRENKTTFRKEFNLVYPEIREKETAQFWNERLNFENEEISWGSKSELTVVIIASLIAALIAKIPEFASINYDIFYPRNIGLIFLPMLAAYFAWKQKIRTKRLVIAAAAILISAIYINILPDNDNSDTLILAYIHMPLVLWAILGFTFVGNKLNNFRRRLDFLRYNGDLVVMTAVMLIAGGLLTAITLGLFSLIDISIEEFYSEYIVICGLAAAPIVGTYLVQTNPQLVSKVSPVIAKVFTPLVLVTLVAYLIAIIYTGKDPYNDRDFLLLFNLLLIGVMAIILFSITGTSKSAKGKIGLLLLAALSIVTILINGIALSAIVFRISEWGITPNRLAVLGSNLLIIVNLVMVAFSLFKAIKNREAIEKVENSIAFFLPIYSAWAIVVTFVFPLLFNFK